MFKKSGTPSGNLVSAIRWAFLLHGFARGQAGLAIASDKTSNNFEAREAKITSIRLAILSYFIEAAFFFSRVRAGQCDIKDVAPTIVIPAAMIAWLLAKKEEHAPGMSLTLT